MKTSAIPNRKSGSQWYEGGSSAVDFKKQVICEAIEEFENFACASDVSEHLHELLSGWITNPDNENAGSVEIINRVYMTTRIISFVARVSKEWASMRYIVLRDKGIES